MSKKILNGTLISDVEYNSYIAIIGYMDAEWTRSEDQQYRPFLHGCDEFISECHNYKLDIEKNHTSFCQANSISQDNPLDTFLFNPVHYIPFGHADGLFITLFDDFDPVHHITPLLTKPLEEICLAFCPTLQSIGVNSKNNIFCELHSLLDNKFVDSTSEHKFQEVMPLLVFTKYKMEGLALLGEGLLFQHTLFKTMQHRITEAIDLLKEYHTKNKTDNPLISLEDIESFKCSFLDLQGTEEIGTLMFCRNYSVAMTIIAVLQTITFDDVFKDNPDLEIALNNSKTHNDIFNLSPHTKKSSKNIKDLNVFTWTNSSLSISHSSLISKHKCNCNGYAEALVKLRIASGHHIFLEENINAVDKGHEYQGPKEYYRYKAGLEDLICAYSSNDERKEFPLMPISSLLKILCDNNKTFGDPTDIDNLGRHVFEIETNFIIPVPKTVIDVFYHKKDLSHNAILIKSLREIQKKLFYPENDYISLSQENESHTGKLSIKRLREIPRFWGLPVSLRRSIELLYKNFAICIADPLLFDIVLDFYDVFATLHGILTKHLPNEWEVVIGDTHRIINQDIVKQLAILIKEISAAFTRRISKVYPEPQIRDMSIDFRGGLNQMLLAADVPVKSSFGLVRKFAFKKEKNKDEAACVTSISFKPGAWCHSLNIGIEDHARISIFDMDVPHVLHIASYCDALHESAHLIFYGLIEEKIDLGKFQIDDDSFMRKRVEEIFADIIMFIFIFGFDIERFLCYKLDNYSKGQININEDETSTKTSFALFIEELIRLFFVVDGVGPHKEPEDWNLEWILQSQDKVEDAFIRFDKMVAHYGPVFSEYQRFKKCKFHKQMGNYISSEFKDIYPKISKILPELWSNAMFIYKEYRDGFIKFNEGTFVSYVNQIKDIVHNGLDKGKPIIQSQHDPIKPKDISIKADELKGKMCIGIDNLALVCQLLYQYISHFERGQIANKAIHLFRNPKNFMHVEYPNQEPYLTKDKPKWCDFQIDRGAPALFCSVPKERRRRLLKQIVVIKSFWGISSSMRLRRLEKIICDNWPDLAT